ncbi:MAG: PQQ-binding-like beta-propeller repeat protein [Gemmataceae bacterium]
MTLHLRLLALLVLVTGLLLSPARSDDWPAFRGPDGSAISRATGLPLTWSGRDNIVWKTELPGAGTSTPIVVGKKVFVTCYSGYNVPGQPRGQQDDLKLHLVCLDRDSGKILWKSDVAPRLPEQANIRDGHGYASSTPVADASRVYAFFGKSGVLAFDHDGKELWRAEVGSELNGWGSGPSLLLDGERLIVNASVESQKLYALDAKTGKEVWTLSGIRESWNTPILARAGDKTELVLAIFGKILGVDPATGKQLWSCATDIPWYMVPSLVAHDGVVYAIGGRPGGGLAVKLGGSGDVTRTPRLWTSKKGGNVSSPIYHEGHLYWMHDNMGIAFCADARTGELIYEKRVPRAGQVYGSPILADGRIYYPGREGTTFVVPAAPRFELLASNSWGERGTYNASPAVAGNRFFVRTDRFLACIGKK